LEIQKPLKSRLRLALRGKECQQLLVSNLPDDSELLLTLSRRQANYSGQTKATVVRGIFSAGPFGAHGSLLPPGDYEIEVVFPLAFTQPSSVRQVVGQNNEKLKGRLVEKGSLGVIAKQVTRVNIGGAASPEADKKARAEVGTNSPILGRKRQDKPDPQTH
jgi:hypothetical protein